MLFRYSILNVHTIRPIALKLAFAIAIIFTIGLLPGIMDNIQAFATGSGAVIRDT